MNIVLNFFSRHFPESLLRQDVTSFNFNGRGGWRSTYAAKPDMGKTLLRVFFQPE